MASIEISQSVGHKGVNREHDVRVVQGLLNLNVFRLRPRTPLNIDGIYGPRTEKKIRAFQQQILDFSHPDGRVDPCGKTLTSLNAPINMDESYRSDQPPAKTLTEADYQKAAKVLDIELAQIKALADVESRGNGFLDNGAPKILFEGHWFHRFTEGKYDSQNPTISYPQWTKAHYLGGTGEYNRYRQALSLNPEAAMKSTSWGKFQIMGFNFSDAGYSSVQNFVSDMKKSEGYQLQALVHFIKSNNMAIFLKNKEWAKFARAYNGPRYAQNQYDVKLKQAYNSYAGNP